MRALGATVFWAIVLTLVGTMFAPVLFGYERYVIAGHSMTGTIPYGSLVYSKTVPASTLKVGDVITIVPPWDPDGKPVTHRLTEVKRGKGSKGETLYQTKGDFNRSEDPGPITFPQAALYEFHIPVVGLAFIYLARFGLFVIGLPALIFGVVPFVRLWRAAADPPDPMAIARKQAGPTGYENVKSWRDVL